MLNYQQTEITDIDRYYTSTYFISRIVLPLKPLQMTYWKAQRLKAIKAHQTTQK